MTINDRTIWQEAQNKPTLIVRDIIGRYPAVDPDFVYTVLLRRGVFKWLSVRRYLIRLKDEWKSEVRALNRRKTPDQKGYLKALERCRADVRRLCHAARWQAPDNDRHAVRWLAQQ